MLWPMRGQTSASHWARRNWPTQRGSTNVRWQGGLDGGALMDVGCYCVSGARLLAGEEPDVVDRHHRVVAVERLARRVLARPTRAPRAPPRAPCSRGRGSSSRPGTPSTRERARRLWARHPWPRAPAWPQLEGPSPRRPRTRPRRRGGGGNRAGGRVGGGTAWATTMSILDLEGPEGTPASAVVKLPIDGELRQPGVPDDPAVVG